MALIRVKDNLEHIFDKSLADLVRGIRSHPGNEAVYIAKCIHEIKDELKSNQSGVKANAVLKLTYLHMIGYDMSWASFNVIEVTSSTKFGDKRTGYLAASQCFNANTDVLTLTTNMIQKDLRAINVYDTGVALTSLACFVSADLARDLNDDIQRMLTHSKPYIRKKAVLMLYRLILKYPDGLVEVFPRLRDMLDDPDHGVQSAAVNVICELARRAPKSYLNLAPTFFRIMTTSTNNWMLIKIIKLFATLTPLDAKLGKKLIEPLTNLIHSTSAMSLLYECINTVIAVLISISSGLPNHASSVQLCVSKLRVLIEDSDQNLKYLGLSAMSKILNTHPKTVQQHKDLILDCLDDGDESIRLRALDLLYGMVGQRNLMEIIQKLMGHLTDSCEASGDYRDQLVVQIVAICSQRDYEHVANFEWYISVLVELAERELHIDDPSSGHGRLIGDQLIDVTIRVKSVRPFAVRQMALFIDNSHVCVHDGVGFHVESCSWRHILMAAAWVCAEYADLLPSPKLTMHSLLGDHMCQMPSSVQAAFVQNSLKLFIHVCRGDSLDNDIMSFIIRRLADDQLRHSDHCEVRERVANMCQILQLLGCELYDNSSLLPADITAVAPGAASNHQVDEILSAYDDRLNPVAPRAQSRVPCPDSLDLDNWILGESFTEADESIGENGTDSDLSEEVEESDSAPSEMTSPALKFPSRHKKVKSRSERARDVETARMERQRQIDSNPHYIKSVTCGDDPVAKIDDLPSTRNHDIDDDDLEFGSRVIPGLARSGTYISTDSSRSSKEDKKQRRKKKKHEHTNKLSEVPEYPIEDTEIVSKALDIPAGASINGSMEDEGAVESELFDSLDLPDEVVADALHAEYAEIGNDRTDDVTDRLGVLQFVDLSQDLTDTKKVRKSSKKTRIESLVNGDNGTKSHEKTGKKSKEKKKKSSKSKSKGEKSSRSKTVKSNGHAVTNGQTIDGVTSQAMMDFWLAH